MRSPTTKVIDELIHKGKTDLSSDEKACWEAMIQAGKILLEDSAVTPFYQTGRSYL